ncbi:27425_t:CDS:1, partial [Gigaspora margarita]
LSRVQNRAYEQVFIEFDVFELTSTPLFHDEFGPETPANTQYEFMH